MRFETQFGPARVSVDADGAVTMFSFGDGDAGDGFNPEVARQVDDFFAGKRQAFAFPLAPKGTEFQKRVWAELVRIPFGETISYGEIGAADRQSGDSRAPWGCANATNPIALIVPCHRVIGTNGKLTGYAGGIELKDKLLAWERADSAG